MPCLACILFRQTANANQLFLTTKTNFISLFEFESEVIGAGWGHSTFEGEVTAPCTTTYNGCELVDFVITNEQVIKAIDMAVTGEDWTDDYRCCDEDGDVLDYFETEEDAIAYAKEDNEVSYIDHMQWHDYLMKDLESWDAEDNYYDGVVWNREDDLEDNQDDTKDESLNEKTNKQRECICTNATISIFSFICRRWSYNGGFL